MKRWKGEQQDYDYIFSLPDDPVCMELTFRQAIFIEAALAVFNWPTRWYSPTDATIDKDVLEAFVSEVTRRIQAGIDGECSTMPSQYVKSIQWCVDEDRQLIVTDVIDGVEFENHVALEQCLSYVMEIQPCEEPGQLRVIYNDFGLSDARAVDLTECGIQGEQGEQGEPGIQGPDGVPGIQGEPGECDCIPENPPLDPDDLDEGADVPCVAAANATLIAKQTVDDAYAIINAGGTFVAVIAAILAVLAIVATGGAATPVVIALVGALIDLGGAGILAAFTSGVYAEFQCILFCYADEDGVWTDADLTAIKADVTAQIGGVAATIFNLILDSWGLVGLNNAATAGGLTSADCAECVCGDEWCYEWDFTANNGTWANWQPAGRGQAGWVSGSGWHQINAGTPSGADAISIRKSWTTAINITKIAVYFDHTMTGTNPWIRVGQFSEVTSLAQNPTPNNPQVWEGSWSWTGLAVLVNQAEGSGVSYFTSNYIKRVKIFGSGSLPSALSSAGGFSPCNF